MAMEESRRERNNNDVFVYPLHCYMKCTGNFNTLLFGIYRQDTTRDD